MADKILTANTIVRDKGTGALHTLEAGQPVPAEYADQVGDHLFEEDALDREPSVEVAVPVDVDDVPPRKGPGSGLAAWAAYASRLGVIVPAGASRDRVIELVGLTGALGADEDGIDDAEVSEVREGAQEGGTGEETGDKAPAEGAPKSAGAKAGTRK